MRQLRPARTGIDRRQFLSAGVAVGAAACAGAAGEESRAMLPVGFAHDALCLEHETGAGHPERPQRLTAIIDRLKEARLWPALRQIEPRDATIDELLSVHDPAYIETVKREVAAGRRSLSTGDTPLSAHSLAAALRAAGATLAAADAVMAGDVRRAFCAVRPPGHHATRSRGMGFCIFNNVAAAARYLQRKHKLARILIVDWDVHHGNGTQDIFYADDTVLYFSTHQYPLYPGTGARDETGSGKGKGFTINCPLPAGAGDRELFEAFDQRLLPAAASFRPDFVLVSAGFDARHDDPLAGLRVTDEGFAQLTQRVCRIADEHAKGRVVSVLEGGYNLAGLGLAVESHIRALGQAT